MEIHLKIIGFLLTALALIHIFFPRYFDWRTELSGLSLINRQMFYVHTFFIALILLLMGVLCLISFKEITETALGHKVSLGFGIFWTIRLLVQFFGYSPALWKGKRLETIIHIVFSMFWLYMSVVFFYIGM